MRRLLLQITLVFVLVSVAQGRELVDQLDRSVEVAEPLTRVVSLAPSLTELSYEVGGGERLVGATRFATYPDAALELPRVGTYVALDIEKIVSLRPQLCLATKDGNPREAVEKLERLGIPVYVFDPKNIEDIIDTVVRLGHIYRTEIRTESLVAEHRVRLEKISAKLNKLNKRPKVFFQIDAQPIFSAGADTFLHQLLVQSGAENLAADRQGYPRYSWEELLALKPEVVLLASMGGGMTDRELLSHWEAWPQIPAVANDELHVVNADLFDRPTLRLFDALEYLVDLLHPELAETQ